VRIPEEQILYPHRRTKRLFDNEPIEMFLGKNAQVALRQSIQDLLHPNELRELGMAIFLDRPLDAGKHPMEPDQTLLLSYIAFSRSLALRRLEYLAHDLELIPDQTEYAACRHLLETVLDVKGVPVDAVGGTARTGAASLADARKAAEDFLFLRTTRQSVDSFFRQYDFGPLFQRFRLDYLKGGVSPLLILRTGAAGGPTGAMMAIYDCKVRKRLELNFNPELGCESRAGIEYPVSPLRVLRIWEETDDREQLLERDLSAEVVYLPPRRSD
jgi:hypothetical protein